MKNTHFLILGDIMRLFFFWMMRCQQNKGEKQITIVSSSDWLVRRPLTMRRCLKYKTDRVNQRAVLIGQSCNLPAATHYFKRITC